MIIKLNNQKLNLIQIQKLIFYFIKKFQQNNINNNKSKINNKKLNKINNKKLNEINNN